MQTVCVVDAEPDVCDLIRIALETRDIRVFCAHDGAKGLDLILKQRPDLVILDVLMPGMNGYELMARIRSVPEVAQTPIILVTSLTANSPISEEEWRERMDVADFITKPFEPLNLIQRVQRALAPASPPQQAPPSPAAPSVSSKG